MVPFGGLSKNCIAPAVPPILALKSASITATSSSSNTPRTTQNPSRANARRVCRSHSKCSSAVSVCTVVQKGALFPGGGSAQQPSSAPTSQISPCRTPLPPPPTHPPVPTHSVGICLPRAQYWFAAAEPPRHSGSQQRHEGDCHGRQASTLGEQSHDVPERPRDNSFGDRACCFALQEFLDPSHTCLSLALPFTLLGL